MSRRRRPRLPKGVLVLAAALAGCHTWRAAGEAFEALPADVAEALVAAPLRDLESLVAFVLRLLGIPGL